mmetsp:Transcript_8802/g.26559  ORF Transcript_8802/g.26559 Transcript_8802/m.26559 type:complete len:290 (-) Transcript_8802:162-1031(-)
MLTLCKGISRDRAAASENESWSGFVPNFIVYTNPKSTFRFRRRRCDVQKKKKKKKKNAARRVSARGGSIGHGGRVGRDGDPEEEEDRPLRGGRQWHQGVAPRGRTLRLGGRGARRAEPEAVQGHRSGTDAELPHVHRGQGRGAHTPVVAPVRRRRKEADGCPATAAGRPDGEAGRKVRPGRPRRSAREAVGPGVSGPALRRGEDEAVAGDGLAGRPPLERLQGGRVRGSAEPHLLCRDQAPRLPEALLQASGEALRLGVPLRRRGRQHHILAPQDPRAQGRRQPLNRGG